MRLEWGECFLRGMLTRYSSLAVLILLFAVCLFTLTGCYSIGEPDWQEDDVLRAVAAASDWVEAQVDLPVEVFESWDQEVVFVGTRFAVCRFTPDESRGREDNRSLEVVVDMETMEVVSGRMAPDSGGSP